VHARSSCVARWLALAASLALSACADDLVVLRPGDPAPELRLEGIEGRPVSLAEQRGNLVLIRFWADWCKSCRTEMPIIEELYRARRDQGFVVLALNVRQSRTVAERFARELGLTYDVLLDGDGETARRYGVVGLPTTFLVDGKGRILEEVIGDLNRESLLALIEPGLDHDTTGAKGQAR